MVYLQINKKNYMSGQPNLIDKLNKHLIHKDDKIFILFYMEGCGPCNATRPEWSKLKNVLSNNFLNRDDIVIVSIDHELVGKLKNIGNEPNSFPTIRYMTNAGEINENYEDSNISKKDRTIDSFVEWIELKSGETNITQSENNHAHSKSRKNRKYKKMPKIRRTRKQRGGKWSLKYKHSINCRRPKGFSQKLYCKYGRK
jgi:thiol-disulfide isomerase/thioredoxin